jgi:hypothetical protein
VTVPDVVFLSANLGSAAALRIERRLDEVAYGCSVLAMIAAYLDVRGGGSDGGTVLAVRTHERVGSRAPVASR